MFNTRAYDLAIRTLVELQPEIDAQRANALMVVPNLDTVLEELGSIPNGNLFLGMADDGLPVLLDLQDPVPGSLMVLGDQGAGKTTFLKSLASVIVRMFDPLDVQFGVITPNVEEWAVFSHFEQCAGVFPIFETSAMDFVQSLNMWAHQNRSRQSFVLLLDGFDRVHNWRDQAISHMRWLSMRGPSRRVWPVVTLNSSLYRSDDSLVSEFRTFIFGALNGGDVKQLPAKAGGIEAQQLAAGSQFAMREGSSWLKFWIPRLEGD